MTSFITVVGTIFVDCKGFASQPYNPAGRNLGNIQFVHGGVARNVAENLANLDLPTAFATMVDDTGLGSEIKQRLSRSRIQTDYMVSTPSGGMGMWLAVMDENGDLAGSISQMPNLTALEHLVNTKGRDMIERSTHVVLEMDLNEQLSRSVIRLAEQLHKPVYGIPGNLDVILKNMDLLGKLDCFICNNIEADLLMDSHFFDLEPSDMIQAVKQFADRLGLKSMVVTLGEKGSVFYDSKTQASGYQPVFPVRLVDSTGAGDAFFSGAVMGLVRGLDLKEAVICGTKIAGWTIESKENTCPDLNSKYKDDPAFQKLFSSSTIKS